MRVHVLSGLCFGIALTSPAVAQTISKPDGAWRGAVNASYTSASGNNESTNASLFSDAVRQTERDKMNASLRSVYGRQETDGADELTASLFRAGVRYDLDFDDLKYGFAGFDSEKDKLADLKWRHSPSVGVGLHLRRTQTFTFDVFAGYSYSREELYSGTKRSFSEGLIGEETTHKFSESTSFRQRLAVYPNLTDSGEYRVVFDAGFLAPLVDRWNLTLNYSVRYQSDPPPGIDKRDTLVFAGLQYGWGPK
jgi:putative salt-induced outer membrane protein YdiY